VDIPACVQVRSTLDERGDLPVRGLSFSLICAQLGLDGSQLFAETIYVHFKE
jgi:hypothetical protein